MAHTVSGKLYKAPFIKEGVGPEGQTKMYSIELSEVSKDYKTGEKEYTNYKAVFFAKSDAAKNYYDQAFAEGSFVVVSCEKIKLDVSDCRQYIRLEMDNARLENAMTQQAPQQQQQYQQPAQQQQQQRQQAPQQQGQGYVPDNIPF